MTVETKDLTKAEIEFLSDKCEKLEIQLNIVLNILLRECPQYEGYVRANFPNYNRG